MAYKYSGTQTVEAEAARKEQLRQELKQARETYQAAQKLRRENERLEAEILRTRQRTTELAKPLPTMPEPIHGGPLGLKRATQEIEAWNKRQKAAA